MNFFDIGIIALIALCAFGGFRTGLIRMVYRLVSFFIAIFLANLLYPGVARFLRGTVLFDSIQAGIKNGLNLGPRIEEMVVGYAERQQYEIINGLNLPPQLANLLNTHFDQNTHGSLNVNADVIEESISTFFANIAINGIAIILVFVLVLVILTIIGRLLNIVGKLPVIRTFNNYGGLLVGIVIGVGIAWLCIVVISMYLGSSVNPGVYDLLNNSFIASRVLESMMPRLAAVA